MHMWNYLHACLAHKFIGVHILSCVLVHVRSKTPKLHVSRYICAYLASKFIGVDIPLRVITSTRATCELSKERYRNEHQSNVNAHQV